MKNKDKYKDRFNLLVLKALKFFIENPYSEIHLREFSRKMKISSNTAQRFLDLFLKENLVKEERKANLRYFKANLQNLVFRQMKITYSIKKITDSGLLNIFKENNFSSVVLFGSVARGEDNELSDIDIVAIGPNKKIDLSKVEKNLDKELNIHFFTFSEWKKHQKSNKAFYQNVISTGINLKGEMPLV